MRFVRDLRLIPVVALAAAALFLLKVSAIVIDGGYTLIASHAALAQGLGAGVKENDFDMPPPAALEDTAPAKRGDPARSWVRDIYGPPEYTGSVAAAPKADAARARGREGSHAGGEHHAAGRCGEAPAFARRARGAGKPAAAPPGTGNARARDRRARQPAQGGGEAHRAAPAGAEGPRGAPHRRCQQEGRGRGREVQEPGLACTRT